MAHFDLPYRDAAHLLIGELYIRHARLLPHQQPQPFAALVQVVDHAGHAVADHRLERLAPVARGAAGDDLTIGLHRERHIQRVSRSPDRVEFAADRRRVDVQGQSGQFVAGAGVPILLPFVSEIQRHDRKSLGIRIAHMHDTACGDDSLDLFAIGHLAIGAAHHAMPPCDRALVIASRRMRFIQSRHRHHSLC